MSYPSTSPQPQKQPLRVSKTSHVSETVISPPSPSLSFNPHHSPRKGGLTPIPTENLTPGEVSDVPKVTQKVLKPRLEHRDRVQTPDFSHQAVEVKTKHSDGAH